MVGPRLALGGGRCGSRSAGGERRFVKGVCPSASAVACRSGHVYIRLGWECAVREVVRMDRGHGAVMHQSPGIRHTQSARCYFRCSCLWRGTTGSPGVRHRGPGVAQISDFPSYSGVSRADSDISIEHGKPFAVLRGKRLASESGATSTSSTAAAVLDHADHADRRS